MTTPEEHADVELSDEDLALLAEAAASSTVNKARKPRATGHDTLEVTTVKGPYPGHPLAPPAQHDYGDPWGLLPIQMRHDENGNRVD